MRRVFGRAVSGVEYPAPSVTRAERDLATDLVPETDPEVWAVAVMELGALVCVANGPRCEECPISAECAWVAAGRPAYAGPARKVQDYDGTDRQCRGRLLAVLREADGSVPPAALERAWADVGQRDRALASLLADGLVVGTEVGYSLPG